jgi:hypothetical protein
MSISAVGDGSLLSTAEAQRSIKSLSVPSAKAKERIIAELADHRHDLTVRKQILWESETATDAEVRVMEMKLIRETDANDPAIGYNLTPRETG